MQQSNLTYFKICIIILISTVIFPKWYMHEITRSVFDNRYSRIIFNYQFTENIRMMQWCSFKHIIIFNVNLYKKPFRFIMHRNSILYTYYNRSSISNYTGANKIYPIIFFCSGRNVYSNLFIRNSAIEKLTFSNCHDIHSRRLSAIHKKGRNNKPRRDIGFLINNICVSLIFFQEKEGTLGAIPCFSENRPLKTGKNSVYDGDNENSSHYINVNTCIVCCVARFFGVIFIILGYCFAVASGRAFVFQQRTALAFGYLLLSFGFVGIGMFHILFGFWYLN